MDNYNPDLIFDLAAGLLPDDEARAAEAGLTAEGRAELEAQRAVLAAIASQPAVAMTDIERARLHRSVADGVAATTRELSPVEVAQPRPAPTTRSIRWVRWASAATAAALFVGVVAVASQLPGTSSSSDATAALNADAARESSATSIAATTAPAAGDLTTTTAVEHFAAGGDGVSEDLGFLEAPPVRDDANSTDLDEVGEFLLDAIETQRLDPLALRSSNPTELACYTEASFGNVILLGFLAPYESQEGEVIEAVGYAFQGTDPDEPPYTYYRPDTCEPILSITE